MLQLVIDVGNTRTKVAVFSKSECCWDFTCNKLTVSRLKEIFKRFPKINRCLFSSVSEESEVLIDWLSKKTIFYILDAKTPLPVRIAYKNTATLGADRKAVACAADYLFPKNNTLIINCGTCITYDFKSATGIYQGGSISPGLTMRLKALQAFTARLPLVELADPVELIGNSTAQSILTGVVFGAASEIDGMIANYKAQFKHLKIVITGGDADRLEKQLKNKIFATPNLTLIGLNHILSYIQP